jgi:hypothetical protein
MCNESTFQKPEPKELRALYDIRVKEAHHYNTMVWAFPAAYAALIAAEIRFIEGAWPVLFAALFNLTLWYTFWRHLRFKRCIHSALLFTEGEISKLYGPSFVPAFPPKGELPAATTVAHWAVAIVSLAFFAPSRVAICPAAPMKKRANKAPEPTTTAVTKPSTSNTDSASRGRG